MNAQIFKDTKELRCRWVWGSENKTAQLLSPVHEVEKNHLEWIPIATVDGWKERLSRTETQR